ncbi:Vitellogenic carboxypeptidase, partial [Reticulomyxa filosa]
NNDTAADLCVNATNDIYSVYGGNIFQYDIRVTNGNAFNGMLSLKFFTFEKSFAYFTCKKKNNLDLSITLNGFSNRPDVKEAVHTVNHTFNDSDGTSSPNPVYDALKYDIVQNNSAIIVKELLDTGLPILFYNGQFDGSICNNLGVQMCLDQMNYKGIWIDLAVKQAVYRYDPTQDANVTIGYVKVLPSDNQLLTYFVVSNSGHLVPMNQPANSQYMIETWIEGGHWST